MNEYPDLDDDEDVVAREKFALAEREKLKKEEANKFKQSLKLTEEQEKEVQELCKASVTVDGTPELNGLLAFEEYIKLFSLIVTLQIRFTIQISEENKEARREALANDDKAAFAETTSKQLDLTNKTKSGVVVSVLDYFNIESELYERSGRHSHDTPEMA